MQHPNWSIHWDTQAKFVTWLERQITKVDFDPWKLGMGL